MIYDITNTNVIYLGRQGENLARTVEIDVNSILGKWPNATISLLVQRNQEDTFYLPAVVIENGILKWTISNADTEFAGDGKAEIRATQDDVIVKSAMMNTHVSDSLGGTETDIPDPAQTWADTIIAASEQAKQSAEDALASELAAKEAAESITGLESNIKTAEAARVEAEKGRAMAESDRVAAEEMRESAETSRETAENNRVAAESSRVAAEESRVSAEAGRVEAEKERISAENERESAESSRGTAESERMTAENKRMTAENKRVTAETARSNAETSRASAEQERQTAEGTRVSAETSRETAENNRVAAETARVTAEQSRASAETARESAETDRQTTFETNEAQRQTAFETAEAGRAAAESSRVAAEESRVSAEAGRVEAESERVTAENQRAETFAGYETRIDAATPDDTVVDGKPWTSKKTVDSLCMPLEESGNLVQVYPVKGYPLDVKVSWEPVQEGEGDPSPDNIRPIKGRDGIKVERCGENLLNISKLKPEGYNLAGSNTLKPNTTYTFKPVSCGGINFAVFLTDNVVPIQTTKQINLTRKYIKEGDSATFTTPSNSDSYSVMWLAGSKYGINQVYPNVQFMLVAGTTAPTAYEPFTGSTTDIALPETVYGGEVDLATGEGQETWACLVLDGTESWGAYTNPTNNGFQYSLYTDVNLPLIEQGDNRVCTHFSTSNFKYWNQLVANNFATNEQYIRVQSLIPTVDEWKSYLAAQVAAGTPVTIAYKLVTPTAFQATGAQSIPALPGTNTIYTDADSVTVSGRADPNHIIQTLSDRIAALENETIEGGTNA